MFFKILCEPSVNAGPRKSSLDDPSFCQNDKDFSCIGKFDNLYEPGRVALGYQPDIGAVGNHFFDEWKVGREPVQRQCRAIMTLNACGMYFSFQDYAKNIDNDMAFASFAILARVEADIAARIRIGFRWLRVNDRQRRAFFSAFEGPHGTVQEIVNALPKARAYPGSKIAVNRLPLRKVFGQYIPLAPDCSR